MKFLTLLKTVAYSPIAFSEKIFNNPKLVALLRSGIKKIFIFNAFFYSLLAMLMIFISRHTQNGFDFQDAFLVSLPFLLTGPVLSGLLYLFSFITKWIYKTAIIWVADHDVKKEKAEKIALYIIFHAKVLNLFIFGFYALGIIPALLLVYSEAFAFFAWVLISISFILATIISFVFVFRLIYVNYKLFKIHAKVSRFRAIFLTLVTLLLGS